MGLLFCAVANRIEQKIRYEQKNDLYIISNYGFSICAGSTFVSGLGGPFKVALPE